MKVSETNITNEIIKNKIEEYKKNQNTIEELTVCLSKASEECTIANALVLI